MVGELSVNQVYIHYKLQFDLGLVCQDSTTLVPNSWTEKEEFEYDPNQPHCYRFTWLGPTYDNTSHVNGTCKDLKLKDTPCKQPFVITCKLK